MHALEAGLLYRPALRHQDEEDAQFNGRKG
jgi:hypothetical protein